MIFQYTIAALLSGRKTQTRRVIYAGDRLTTFKGARAVVTLNGRPRWVVGKDYPVFRRRGFKAEPGVRVRVIGLSKRPNPAAISEADARAEGYASAAEFAERWRARNRGRSEPCWKIEFELVRLPAGKAVA